jgi:hypothetical protein
MIRLKCYSALKTQRIFFAFCALIISSLVFAQNPIVIENQLTGDSTWEILGLSAGSADSSNAAHHEIEGYVSSVSVNRGDSIKFYVRCSSAYTYFNVNVYRMGWYGGKGGRKIMQRTNQSAKSQPNCVLTASTGLLECNWNQETPISTAGWLTGVYLIKLSTVASPLKQSQLIVVVKHDSLSDFLFQTSPTTYQAYNNWGEVGHNGMSLYSYVAATVSNDSLPIVPRAVTVSFDRPYGPDIHTAPGAYGQRTIDQSLSHFLKEEYPMLRFLEKNGYDVSYTTDLDVGLDSTALLHHKAILISGHGEYWNMATRHNLEYARDHFVNIAFLAANTGYWQVRYNNDILGKSNRRIVAYKESATSGTSDTVYVVRAGASPNRDPSYHTSDSIHTTTNFRNPPVNMPENSLIGVMFDNVKGSDGFELPMTLKTATMRNQTPLLVGLNSISPTDTSYTTLSTSHILGYEADTVIAPHTGKTSCIQKLGLSPWSNSRTGKSGIAVATIYRAPNNGGGTVFGAGTILWSWALDDFGSSRRMGDSSKSYADPIILGVTKNLLQWFKKTPTAASSNSCFLPLLATSDIIARDSTTGNWNVALSNGTAFVPTTSAWLTSTWASSPSTYNLMVGDFNGDGKKDLLRKQLYSPGNWDVALSTATSFSAAGTWLTGWAVVSSAYNLMVADVNGDGKDDLIAKEATTGTWYVALSSGSGFTAATSAWLTGWATTSSGYNLMVGDFNGDGKKDILKKQINTPGNWDVALSTASSFSISGTWLTGWAVVSSAYNLMVGDVNGDGKDDLIAKEATTGTWYVALSTGSGFTAASSTWLTGWASNSSAYNLMVGDYNGDGKTDLLAKEITTGTWYVALSDGTKFIAQPYTWLSSWSTNSSLYNFLIGDCDNK